MKHISRIAFREATHDKPGRSLITRVGMALGSLAAVAFPGMMISGLAAQNDAVTKKPAVFAEAFGSQLPEGTVPIGSVGAGSPNSTSGLLDSKATEALPIVRFSLPTGSVTTGEAADTKVDFFTAQYPGSGSQSTKECPKGGAIVGQGIEDLLPGDTVTIDGQPVCVAEVTKEEGYVGRVGVILPEDSGVASAMELSLVPGKQAGQVIESHLAETGQQLEIVTPDIMRERTEKLWEDSSNSLFGLAKNLGAISGILLVGGLAGFSANRRRTIHNNLMLAGATRRQIFGLEFRASALSLIPGAILGSAMLSELVIGAANDQTLNLGAELTPSNMLAGLSATLAGGGLATAAAAFSSARKANPRGEA